MPRGQLPKAYLRVDPNIDQVHPDPGAMIGLLCVANRQPHRGRFRDRSLLEKLLGKRLVQRLYERGDVYDLPDGRVLVPGWDEWQEGDHTVADRQRRIRRRRNGDDTAGGVT